jgi:hypothetical protein
MRPTYLKSALSGAATTPPVTSLKLVLDDVRHFGGDRTILLVNKAGVTLYQVADRLHGLVGDRQNNLTSDLNAYFAQFSGASFYDRGELSIPVRFINPARLPSRMGVRFVNIPGVQNQSVVEFYVL